MDEAKLNLVYLRDGKAAGRAIIAKLLIAKQGLRMHCEDGYYLVRSLLPSHDSQVISHTLLAKAHR